MFTLEREPETPREFVERGLDKMVAKQYALALADFSLAITMKSNYAWAYLHRGNAYCRLGEYDSSISDYSQAIQLEPDFEIAFFARAEAYKNRFEFQLAEADYSRALELNPHTSDVRLHIARGKCYRFLREHSKSVMDETHAIQMQSDCAEAYFLRGEAHEKLGNLAEALADFVWAVSLNSSCSQKNANVQLLLDEEDLDWAHHQITELQKRLRRQEEESRDTSIRVDVDGIPAEEVGIQQQEGDSRWVELLQRARLDRPSVVGWFRSERIQFKHLGSFVSNETVLKEAFPRLGDRMDFISAVEETFAETREPSPGSQTQFSISCPFAVQMRNAALSKLGERSFDHRFSVCFCSQCAAGRGMSDTLTRLASGREFSVPHGWLKLGISVSDQRVRDGIFEWCTAFHGTKSSTVVQILQAGEFLRPGRITRDGQYLGIRKSNINYKTLFPKAAIVPGSREEEQRNILKEYCKSVFVSPCLNYASLYASPFLFEEKAYQFVLQVRIEPNSFNDSLPVPPFLLGQKHTVGHFDDPLFQDGGCLEWYTPREHVIVLTGLLVREVSVLEKEEAEAEGETQQKARFCLVESNEGVNPENRQSPVKSETD